MSLLKHLRELLNADVITPEVAERIELYYQNRKIESRNRLFIVFGVLGAILVGLGIILIIAHNWDDLPRTAKTVFAFMPLIIGQTLCVYVLIKKFEAIAWREASAVFVFLSIGASISLVSQIYNIPGNLSSFLLTWTILGLPLVYIMQSSVVSLLFISGITWYATLEGYWSYQDDKPYLYWILLLGLLPFYFVLLKKRPHGNFVAVHHWFIPLSIIISLGTVAKSEGELLFIAYFSLFGLFLSIGNRDGFNYQNNWMNGYRFLGSLGTIVLLFVLSFDWFWKTHRGKYYTIGELFLAPEFIVSTIVSCIAVAMLIMKCKEKDLKSIGLLEIVFLLFIVTFILGLYSPLAIILINLYVLALGISTVRQGAQRDHLGVLNYGLLIITTLVICRFFDSDLSFVLRGILFLCVGVGFFLTNYWTIKKRAANE